MRARRLLSVLAAALLAGALPSAAQELRFIAFGDSVTEGFGDTSPGGGGYPSRLQRWLRQRGYDATVLNYGQGGETTAQALSRVDDVLDQGGDFFLLMEGTNDISHRVGIESITFNLNQMALRAEERGMVTMHASTILRRPDAPVDSDNARTSALAASIRDLGEVRGRAVADVFTLFESLPDLFDAYYYQDTVEEDPVGHPNGAGYNELGGLILETVLALLESPRIEVLPPAAPVGTGVVTTFDAVLYGDFARLEWDFGDGGWAASDPPLDLSVEHVYLAPGTYTVTLRGETAGGGASSDQIEVQVVGSPASWPSLTTLIPIVERGDGSEPTDLVSDLWLQNFGSKWLVAEVALAPEITYDQLVAGRSLLVAPGASIGVRDLLASLFGLSHVRAGLVVTARVEPGGSAANLVPFATLSLFDDEVGSSSDTVEEVPPGHWTTGQKVIGGISGGASTSIEVAVANLDGAGGYVQLDLFDGLGAPVDSALFELEPFEVRFRSLTDLFRRLESRPQPFSALFRVSGVRFVAAIVESNPVAGQVVHLASSP